MRNIAIFIRDSYLSKILLHVGILLTLCCYNNTSCAQSNSRVKLIPVVKVQKTILFQVLDSVIAIERNCVPYNDSLTFIIAVHDSCFAFQSDVDFNKSLNWMTYGGCFKYNGHTFLTISDYKTWFEKTGTYEKFSYQLDDSPPNMSDNVTVFTIFWNRFILIRKESCE